MEKALLPVAAKICKEAVIDPAAKAALDKLIVDEFLSREELDNLCAELGKRLAFAHRRTQNIEKALDDARVPADMVLGGVPCQSLCSRIEVMVHLANQGHRFREMRRFTRM
jgi:hypothetical protein